MQTRHKQIHNWYRLTCYFIAHELLFMFFHLKFRQSFRIGNEIKEKITEKHPVN